jgi:CheY-like chemotaxis protein
VLVVDDEPAVCALIGDERGQQGYDCTVAAQPEQSLGLLDGDAFDLIPADISMPRFSGLDVLACANARFDPKIAAAALAWCQPHREALFLPGRAAPARQEVA